MHNSMTDMQRDFLSCLQNKDASKIAGALADRPLSRPGLRAYIHAYSSRLVEALDNDHPCLGNYLGDEKWQAMCAAYIDKYPSTYRSLRNFGDSLPKFLLEEAAFANHPEISELANIEREFLNCFDAADADSSDFAELLRLPEQSWPHLRLSFHPSLRIVRHRFNTLAIWQAIKEKQMPPRLVRQESSWILWRDMDRVTSFRSAEAVELFGLEHFLGGGNFSQICEKLLADFSLNEVPMIALGLIKSWYAEGWIIQTGNPS